MLETLAHLHLPSLMFYIFGGILMLSAVAIISVRSTVQAVLFLILAFFNGAGLMLLVGAEFLSMVLVIVYVGAVAVLFLFVVMMLSEPSPTTSTSWSWRQLAFWRHWDSFGRVTLSVVSFLLVLEGTLLMISQASEGMEWAFPSKIQDPAAQGALEGLTNTHQLGAVLYDTYFYPFQLAGCILLVAMVGAIIITYRRRQDTHRQNVAEQVARTQANSLVLTSPGLGEGVKKHFTATTTKGDSA